MTTRGRMTAISMIGNGQDPRIIPVGGELPPMDPAPPRGTRPTTAEGGKDRTDPPKGKRTAAGRFRTLNAFVDLTLAELGRAEIAVWLVLFRGCRDGLARTGQTDIARRAGIGRRSVYNALRRLDLLGLVVRFTNTCRVAEQRWTAKVTAHSWRSHMPGPLPHCRPRFSEEFLGEARRLVAARTAASHLRQRARLVLLLHEQPSLSNVEAAGQFDLHPNCVRRWRQRWDAGRFTFEDNPGRGRKPVFSPLG